MATAPTDEERVAEKLRALAERQQQRKVEIDKRRAERLGDADPNESSQLFYDRFRETRGRIEANVEAARGLTERRALSAEFDGILKRVRELQGFLSESVRFLPPYDVQQSQKQIDSLSQHVTETMDELMPKKKFAFKGRRQRVATEPKKERANISEGPVAAGGAAAVDGATKKLVVACPPGGAVKLGSGDVDGKDVEMKDLSKCTVELAGQPNAFHIKGLRGCTIRVGPVSRSLLISDCVDCTFWIACQQLRVHGTTSTDFYLHVTSRAIIEDCHGLRFAPYSWLYPGIEADYTASGLDRARNAWNDVDDFKWLNPNAPSPNWAVLPEGERRAP